MENSISVKRGQNFKGENGQNSSGFWLSIAQLHTLAEDLRRQGSSGAGFLVGHENSQFGVEILPLSGNLEPYTTKDSPQYGYNLGDEISITEVKGIRGHIETGIEIIHINEYSQEAQRFPPPEV